jgi:hypothetical protein
MTSEDGITTGNSSTDSEDSQDACAGVGDADEPSAAFNLAEWLQLVESAGVLEAIPLLPTYGHADVGWTDDCVSVGSCSIVLGVRAHHDDLRWLASRSYNSRRHGGDACGPYFLLKAVRRLPCVAIMMLGDYV